MTGNVIKDVRSGLLWDCLAASRSTTGIRQVL